MLDFGAVHDWALDASHVGPVALASRSRTPTAFRPRLFGLDQINIMLTLYLAIGPSGQTLSLDRWLALRRLARIRPAAAGTERRPPIWPSG